MLAGKLSWARKREFQRLLWVVLDDRQRLVILMLERTGLRMVRMIRLLRWLRWL